MSTNPKELHAFDDDPLWYKDAIIYELHVRSFFDSVDDGIGDFRGLTQKLDYLEELGVTALWLLPFYPSPLRDDGYDIADYSRINPSYGTMRDFKEFLREAHRRGLRVITELVINHTSDQHPWFQRARRAKRGSAARDFYVWSDDPAKYSEARIIFKDFEPSNWSWDPVAQQYYWHRFFAHQPDLNFDNPAVHDAVLKAMEYWFRMGVDGMRLDAIPYLYEREGTNCENLPETHVFLKKLRAHIDARFPNRMLLAEANQWPEDTVPYFGDGDECHMAFHFPVMPRLFMAIRMEDRFPILDILRQTPSIPESSQWAMFLRNHDELTLEMVTDEERDYMYRVYASDTNARINLGIRRRLAPLLGNDRRTIELMNSLLFSMPGTPVLYYGDEIGMGDNIYLGDRNGVRTPMQWSGDRNAGFSKANPQKLILPPIIDPEYHFGTINVEAQQRNTNSLLWWMRRMIALRKQYKAFGRGSIEFLQPANRKVLAFLRVYGEERILVVANLSRLVQYVELDLHNCRGLTPIEMLGRSAFPEVSDRPLSLTLGPHAFYWFSLERRRAEAEISPDGPRESVIRVTGSWRNALDGPARSRLSMVLPTYMRQQRWYQGKGKQIRTATITDVVDLDETRMLVMLQVEYIDGDPETYVFPMGYAAAGHAEWLRRERPRMIIAHVVVTNSDREDDGLFYDCAGDTEFGDALLGTITSRRKLRGDVGEIAGDITPVGRARLSQGADLTSAELGVDQSNTSLRFGREFVFKLFRRMEEGTSLELELGRVLTQADFRGSPRVAGAIEYEANGNGPRTVGVLHEFVPNEGNAWNHTLDFLGSFYEHVVTTHEAAPRLQGTTAELLALAAREPEELARRVIGTYLADARLLGQRTGELHIALSSDVEDPAFTPEYFTLFYQRSLYQSMRNLAGRVTQLLQHRKDSLPAADAELAQRIVEAEEKIFQRYRRILDGKIQAVRIRVHGDYHLGQVLDTGKDFIITDFEGEPARALSERRIKRQPLLDVAGMLRSFDYAASTALRGGSASSLVGTGNIAELERWGRYWYAWTSAAFLRGYLDTVAGTGLVPDDDSSRLALLDSYVIDKAVYEINYELHNRPDWFSVPAAGLLRLLEV